MSNNVLCIAGEFFPTVGLFIRLQIIHKSFRICLCVLEHSYFDSDQDKITENEMITFYPLRGEFLSIEG